MPKQAAVGSVHMRGPPTFADLSAEISQQGCWACLLKFISRGMCRQQPNQQAASLASIFMTCAASMVRSDMARAIAL